MNNIKMGVGKSMLKTRNYESSIVNRALSKVVTSEELKDGLLSE